MLSAELQNLHPQQVLCKNRAVIIIIIIIIYVWEINVSKTSLGFEFRWEFIFNDVPSAKGADGVRVERYNINPS